MFKLLSEESISETPRKPALHVSIAVHVFVIAFFTWFTVVRTPAIRFQPVRVFAGNVEPVRAVERLLLPSRSSHRIDRVEGNQPSRKIETSQIHQPEDKSAESLAPTMVPSEFLALLNEGTPSEPSVALDEILGNHKPALLAAMSPDPVPPPPGPPPLPVPDRTPPPVIGGRLEPAVPIKQPLPVYPPLARTANVQGSVILHGVVSVLGDIQDIEVVSGHPMLVRAAIDGVKKWKYRPAKLNGQPVSCPIELTVNFVLQRNAQ
jgi:TonB family protein